VLRYQSDYCLFAIDMIALHARKSKDLATPQVPVRQSGICSANVALPGQKV